MNNVSQSLISPSGFSANSGANSGSEGTLPTQSPIDLRSSSNGPSTPIAPFDQSLIQPVQPAFDQVAVQKKLLGQFMAQGVLAQNLAEGLECVRQLMDSREGWTSLLELRHQYGCPVALLNLVANVLADKHTLASTEAHAYLVLEKNTPSNNNNSFDPGPLKKAEAVLRVKEFAEACEWFFSLIKSAVPNVGATLGVDPETREGLVAALVATIPYDPYFIQFMAKVSVDENIRAFNSSVIDNVQWCLTDLFSGLETMLVEASPNQEAPPAPSKSKKFWSRSRPAKVAELPVASVSPRHRTWLDGLPEVSYEDIETSDVQRAIMLYRQGREYFFRENINEVTVPQGSAQVQIADTSIGALHKQFKLDNGTTYDLLMQMTLEEINDVDAAIPELHVKDKGIRQDKTALKMVPATWNVKLGAGNLKDVYVGRLVVEGYPTKQYYAIAASRRPMLLDEITQGAALSSGFDHPNVLRTADYFKTRDGGFYIVSPLCTASVSDLFNQKSFYEPSERRKVMTDIVEGLYYLHSRSMTSLNINPSNVFKNRSGDYQIAGWGRLSADRTSFSRDVSSVHLAPELTVEGQDKDFFKADVFSVAITLLEIYKGRSMAVQLPYFPGPSLDLRQLEAVVAGIKDPVFRGIIQSSTHPDPSLRWTADQLRDAVLEWLES